MKKLFISMFAIAALAACSKSEEPQVTNPDNALVPITLSAGINTSVETKAAITGTKFTAATDIIRVAAYKGSNAPADWSAPAFQDQKVDSDTNGAISFQTSQYYPVGGENYYFYAWTTAGAGTLVPASGDATVTYTITGQEDIMTAKDVTGHSKSSNSQPAFAFTHLLKQVKFIVKKDASYPGAGLVTAISIADAKTTTNLNVATGALTFNASPTGDLEVYSDSGVTMDAGGVAVPGSVMFEEGNAFNVDVTADGVTYSDVAITLATGAAGKSHTVTLTFQGTGVLPTASITDWTSGDSAEKPIK